MQKEECKCEKMPILASTYIGPCRCWTFTTIPDFYRLSGLKISMSKTKAIWFGSGFDNNNRLCQDIALDWDSKFTLLGIDFDNNLENMDIIDLIKSFNV